MSSDPRHALRPVPVSPPRALILALAVAAALVAPTSASWWTAEAQDAPDDGLPNVTVVATGGTIAGTSTTPVSFQRYRAGQLSIEQLLSEIPLLDEFASVDGVQFGNRGSGGYSIADLYDLTHVVEEALETADGVVVTSGTDTMEEIGFWLDLTVRSPKPVVMTGAMRPWEVVSTDGHANLLNAIKLAGSGRTAYFGTVLMLNDEIHAVRDVTKGNTLRMDTFETRELGMLGYIDEDRIRVFRAPARALYALQPGQGVPPGRANLEAWRTPFDLSDITKDDLPRVGIVYNAQEMGGEGLTGFVDAGYEGVVTVGTGAGGIGGMTSARNAAVQQGVVFVQTSRTGAGASAALTNPRRGAGGTPVPPARVEGLARAPGGYGQRGRAWVRARVRRWCDAGQGR